MSMSDSIADMLCRIKNAQMAGIKTIEMPSTKLKQEVARVLHEEGYINSVEVKDIEGNKKILEIELKYYQGKPVIEFIKKISKPSLRIYKTKNEIPEVLNGLGIAVVSTSQGVMTGKNAKVKGIGGEVICQVA